VSPPAVARGILAALALAATLPAAAQAMVGGVGVGYGTYPVAPVVIVPLHPLPYGIYPDLRFADELPSCYRVGRCSLRDIDRLVDRLNRLERLAPAAPQAAPGAVTTRLSRGTVVPTPEEEIRAEYRGASVPRAEFSESGRPR
jgi:hypothetical protein